MIRSGTGRGVTALLVAYLVVFVVTIGVVGAVILGRVKIRPATLELGAGRSGAAATTATAAAPGVAAAASDSAAGRTKALASASDDTTSTAYGRPDSAPTGTPPGGADDDAQSGSQPPPPRAYSPGATAANSALSVASADSADEAQPAPPVPLAVPQPGQNTPPAAEESKIDENKAAEERKPAAAKTEAAARPAPPADKGKMPSDNAPPGNAPRGQPPTTQTAAVVAPPQASIASPFPPPPPEKPRRRLGGDERSALSSTVPANALTPAALLEPGPYGPLPRIAADGRLPWIVNDGRFDHTTRKPRIAILVTGLGLDPSSTEDAIIKLPAEISLAFVPYAPGLPRWSKLARAFGHEVLLAMPLEGGSATAAQALGPRVLRTEVSSEENADRLAWLLGRTTGYIGVVTWEGSTFLADAGVAQPILREIADRGLMVVDSRMAPKTGVIQKSAASLGLPFAKSLGFFDEPHDKETIDANLRKLEGLASERGFALAMAVAFPVTIDRLLNWSRTVTDRGYVLAPVTGVTECDELCQQRVRRHAEAVAARAR